MEVENKNPEKPNIESKVKEKLGEIYDSNPTTEDRVGVLLKRIERTVYEDSPVIEVIPYESLLSIIEKIKSIDSDEGRADFVNIVYNIVYPLAELELNHSELVRKAIDLWNEREDKLRMEELKGTKENDWERRQKIQEEAAQKENLYFASEILHYDIKGDTINLHIAPARDLLINEFRKDVISGLKNLAQIVKNNDQISIISGQSWIVTENPKLLEMLGFNIIHPQDGKDDVAIILRDDFLNKYLS
ncbi:MAG: hypothetical protein WCT26_02070 [Candidatus Buchananbacteria bacterium]|jgi:hypothetical protein